jgi:hypothetical protein
MTSPYHLSGRRPEWRDRLPRGKPFLVISRTFESQSGAVPVRRTLEIHRGASFKRLRLSRGNYELIADQKKKKQEWKLVFEHFDKDRSGTIDGFELQSAMNQFGMKIPPNLMPLVLAKFCTSAPQRNRYWGCFLTL